ncbi:Por secretion system C-terminal sorting domain-containing protein [Mariniphaga anaerophila]|uniref:Por secretion system C-terminal sorting domain-containing protein n=1 Tax=Mariniphaga anaerophila TaxID=1484053 RepID=A0A1M4W4Q0_9BACT|nr:S8 family serine peptidase [Mariniphaga anaerophila]SHE76125.1 Por secretion system C-terminal sorting domain-containing protein [Mariniphaga anaerophila]
MKVPFFLILIAILFGAMEIDAQNYYWVAFHDKDNSPYSLLFPEEFLSSKALQRRRNQNIAIDSLDLPVNPNYVQQTLALGATLKHSSKWLNGITVKASADSFVEEALLLPFVKEVQLTKRSTQMKSAFNKFAEPECSGSDLDIDTAVYGESVHQVAQLNGQFLHNNGFRGEEMYIAVFDAGFYKADQYPAFDSLWINRQIAGIKDFVAPKENFFDGHYHGMSVLSIMGGNIAGKIQGTAPKATYWLVRSEDPGSEFLIEEDNWVAAAEFADSVGVDIINSSLGYFTFDDPAMDHTYDDMDGKTTRVAKAANIAVAKGMLVFASAGNEGRENNPWKYIISPSDGDSVIAVGAVNKDGIPAPFTSRGPASDGDVKPNVSAMGWNTIVQRSSGTIGTGNGTSYSSPVIAGAAACLWQANLLATASQVKNAIERSANLYLTPDTLSGYGIPDLKIADKILKTAIFEDRDTSETWLVYPNPASDYIVLQKQKITLNKKVQIAFYSLDGKLLKKEEKNDAARIMLKDLYSLPRGLLILQIISDDETETLKIAISP